MGLAVWRDISLLWLILLAVLAILPITIVFYLAVRGMHRLRQAAKRFFPIVQEKTRLLADKTEEISLKVTEPIIGVHAKSAQVNGLRRAIFTRRK